MEWLICALQREKKNVNRPSLFFEKSLFLCFSGGGGVRWNLISFWVKSSCRLFSTSDRLGNDKVFDIALVL